MSTRKVITIVLVASAVMLAVGLGPRFTGTAQALRSAQEHVSAGITIPYTGHLTDDVGLPVADGLYDFTFALYAVEAGGEPLWSEGQTDVVVQEGTFNAMLGDVNTILMNASDSSEYWLAVSVRGPGEADFTALTPRQRLSTASPVAPASPSAGAACPHDHWGEAWTGTGIGLFANAEGGGSSASLVSLLSAVYGNHDVFYGVLGQSNFAGIGVGGSSQDKYGVYGISTNSYGGWFESDNDHFDLALGGAVGRINSNPDDENSELYLSSNADVIVKLDNDGGEDHSLRIKNSGGTDVCTVSEDTAVGLVCTAKSAVVKTANYGQRLLYVMESPEVWFEDFGSATLIDGEVTVAFEPIFAETVNLAVDYHVFVTPLCDKPVLLFVTTKSPKGFTVQGVTLDGQPAACAFDYRIAAKRLGYESMRLEETTWQGGEQ